MDEASVDDSDATIEDVPDDSIHPKQLVNETPPSLLNIFYIGLSTLQMYGWFILFGLIFLYILYRRLKPHIVSTLARRNSDAVNLHRYDMDEAYRRQEAMDAARRRMQERFDQQAAQFAESQRKKEEEKRKAKIEDWDRHIEGKGYRTKHHPTEDGSNSPSQPPSEQKPPKKKTTYRQADYNPLMGDSGGSCSYRPSPRGGGARGGG